MISPEYSYLNYKQENEIKSKSQFINFHISNGSIELVNGKKHDTGINIWNQIESINRNANVNGREISI